MDAAASHCGCGLHDHQRMLKRGQGKKQSGERQREKEGGRERGRERGREGGKLAEVIAQLSQSRGHCCMSHGEWFIASVSVLTGNSHTRAHTQTHKHTAYLVMVQRAAPARTERNWINGALGAKYRKLSIRT